MENLPLASNRICYFIKHKLQSNWMYKAPIISQRNSDMSKGWIEFISKQKVVSMWNIDNKKIFEHYWCQRNKCVNMWAYSVKTP